MSRTRANPEVEDLELTVARDEEVRRFDVLVNDPCTMRGGEDGAELVTDREDDLRRASR